eukprot:SAG11_NODE_11325_length_768_cov_1.612855_1_plen_58_part_00
MKLCECDYVIKCVTGVNNEEFEKLCIENVSELRTTSGRQMMTIATRLRSLLQKVKIR